MADLGSVSIHNQFTIAPNIMLELYKKYHHNMLLLHDDNNKLHYNARYTLFTYVSCISCNRGQDYLSTYS